MVVIIIVIIIQGMSVARTPDSLFIDDNNPTDGTAR